MNNYHTITIGGEAYKLRLTVNATIAIEKRLGQSLYAALENIQYGMVETMAIILWGALQSFHGNISFDEAAGLFDQYIDEGHAIEDMMRELNTMFTVSGFFGKGQAE